MLLWSPPSGPQTQAALATSAPVAPWQLAPQRQRAAFEAADGSLPDEVIKTEITREILDRIKLCIRSGGRFDESTNQCCDAVDGMGCHVDPIHSKEQEAFHREEEARERSYKFAAVGALVGAAILWAGFRMGKVNP